MSKGFLRFGRVLFLAAGCATTGVSKPLVTDPDEARLLDKNTLRFPVAGCITGAFSQAFCVLQESNLLVRVQEVYASQLPYGVKPEFEVKATSGTRYYYVNKDDERCDIRELWRETDSNTWFTAAFYVTGERRFGTFESLIYMKVACDSRTPADAITYSTDVRVWPHGALTRIVLRHLPGVESYFRKKTAEMRSIITSVFAGLVSKTTPG